MLTHHRTLLGEITARQRKGARHPFSDSYLASGHRYYSVSVPERRSIAKAWLRANKALPAKEFVALLDALFAAESHEEKTVAAILLASNAPVRAAISTKRLDAWLGHLVGWAEIDSLCAGTFKAEEMLADWRAWVRFIRTLTRDKNINKRRAALVFLTGPVHRSADERIAALAFATIERLKAEREIIITKAVSWLLRAMTTHHKKAVAQYIAKERASLPAIAVRETARKIKTGRK